MVRSGPVLDVRHLHVWAGARVHDGSQMRPDRACSGLIPLVRDISFTLERGGCLGIVGESGSGKTLVCRSLLGLLPASLAAQGEISFGGRTVQAQAAESQRVLASWRGRGMAMVLQQPMTAFDPLYTVGAQFKETLEAHGLCSESSASSASSGVQGPRPAWQGLARRMLARVRLASPGRVLRAYPHELSGGMLQRCMIALALALEPQVIIADEPTTALDAESQYEVLQRFKDVRAASHTALIVVSHDFGVVQHLADTILVMQHGQCVEYGHAATVLHNPRHPHTQELVRTRLALSRAFTALMRPAC